MSSEEQISNEIENDEPTDGQNDPILETDRRESLSQRFRDSILLRSVGNAILLIAWIFAAGLSVYVILSGQYSDYIVSQSIESGIALTIAYGLYLITYRLFEKRIQHILVFAMLSLFVSYYIMFYLLYSTNIIIQTWT